MENYNVLEAKLKQFVHAELDVVNNNVNHVINNQVILNNKLTQLTQKKRRQRQLSVKKKLEVILNQEINLSREVKVKVLDKENLGVITTNGSFKLKLNDPNLLETLDKLVNP